MKPRCSVLGRITKKMRLDIQAHKELVRFRYSWLETPNERVPKSKEDMPSYRKFGIEINNWSNKDFSRMKRHLRTNDADWRYRLGDRYSKPWRGTSGWGAGANTRINRRIQRAYNKRQILRMIKHG